jgi:hypothetical protein
MVQDKANVKQCFNYTEMGKLMRHLGIWYEWKQDEDGEAIILATMPKMIDEIVQAYKKHTRNEVSEELFYSRINQPARH